MQANTNIMKWSTLQTSKVSKTHRHHIENNIQDNDCEHERSDIATNPTGIIISNSDTRNNDKPRRGDDQKQVESDTTARVRGKFETEEPENNQGPKPANAELFGLSDGEDKFPLQVVWTYE